MVNQDHLLKSFRLAMCVGFVVTGTGSSLPVCNNRSLTVGLSIRTAYRIRLHSSVHSDGAPVELNDPSAAINRLGNGEPFNVTYFAP